MIDPQELANNIGATQRATEAAIAAGDLTTAAARAAEQHVNLTNVFAFLRDHVGGDLALDWDQIAGNTGRVGGAHTSGGGPKNPPPSDG